MLFVALEVQTPHYAGIFGGVLNILTKPKPIIGARQAFSAVYGVIVAQKPIKSRDWQRITSLADKYSNRMLLPANVAYPAGCEKPEFPQFERDVLLKTAIEIISRTRMPMYRRVVGLVDKTGEYADYLSPLLHHYTSVKVLSGASQIYEVQSARILNELGAPVMLCDEYSSFSDCVLVIAPNGVDTLERLKCPILSIKPPAENQHGDFITGLRVVPPPENAFMAPQGIDSHDFLAALYEFCGVKQVSYAASHMTCQCQSVELSHVVRLVMQTSGTLSLF